jgi:hypothetical protein
MSCPDRYTKCPLTPPSAKNCKYLDSAGLARIQIRKDCLNAKQAGTDGEEIGGVTGPGKSGTKKPFGL